jgi:hypothetical protein
LRFAAGGDGLQFHPVKQRDLDEWSAVPDYEFADDATACKYGERGMGKSAFRSVADDSRDGYWGGVRAENVRAGKALEE